MKYEPGDILKNKYTKLHLMIIREKRSTYIMGILYDVQHLGDEHYSVHQSAYLDSNFVLVQKGKQK